MGRRTTSLEHINSSTKCNACDLFVRDCSVPTGEEGRRCPVMFISDTTSSGDVTNQSHYRGRQSNLIREFVSMYQLDALVEYRNMICCQAEFNEYVYNKCKHNLFKFIAYNKPKLIVLIGRTVYNNFIKDDDYNRNLYKFINCGKFIVFTIDHPYRIKTIDTSYSKYIKGFNLISDLVSKLTSDYTSVHYDTFNNLGL